MLQVFASTPETMGPESIGAYAARAEAIGFDGLLVADAIHDGLLLSAMALNATQKLIVGTGVLVAFPRSPMTVAVASWDLQKMSGGRFELGLGTQIKANIEQRYSSYWGKPVVQMREYVQSLKAIFHSFQTAEPLNFQGQYYQFTKLQPFFNPGAIEHPDIPIFCGAIGPLMTKMAGAVADGMITHPTNTPPRYINEVCLPRLMAGWDKRAPINDPFTLTLAPLVATGKTEDEVNKEWEKQRQLLAFLYSTPAYWPSLELFGWQDKGEQLRQLTRSGDWGALKNVMTDEVLSAFVLKGAYDDIADRYLGAYQTIGSHLIGQRLTRRVTFPMPADAADDGAVASVIQRIKA